MTEKQIIMEIIQSVKPELIMMLVYVCIAAFLILILKGVIESVVAYFFFTINKQLGLNAKVEVRGKTGIITDFNLRWIIVRTSTGIELVKMKYWEKEQWSIIYNNRITGARHQDSEKGD